jgi:hypothetical protein
MKAQTFIFVHDQYIVLDYLAAGKFNNLPNVKYVFLGQRPSDQIGHLVDMGKVIIARDLPDNIEHLPNLVAWTGWYALVKNNLITAEVVNLFEYDVNVVGNWVQSEENTNYFPYPRTDDTWWNYNGIGTILRYVCDDDFEGENLPMTSNYTLKKDTLRLFVRDMEIFYWAKDPQAGHITERYYSYIAYPICVVEPNRLTHLYADSHGTQGRGDRYQDIKYKLL